ncbi:methyltransferase [Streptomyces violascens]|uniref:Methyltransferase n=1 Tax=Streptomyces violascens TaxID=67381 RepID=A0ABQ3QRT9_9ACTN|nr:methyltransferase dimerization domain-containing protein [Streptomyces violascens]GGT84800.1 methyltransferase [Streptomyces violascens]GHI40001.1 methyltransferase [Streptomyces violascens]
MDAAQPSPEKIMQIATGNWAASILAVGAIHSVFTHLDNGSATPQDVAKQAGISVRGSQVLLDGLVGLGLVEVSDGAYRNSPEASAFLVEGKPSYFGAFARHQFMDMARWSTLPEVARTGDPVAPDTADVTENPFWESLVPAIAPLSVPSALTAAEKLDLAQAGAVSVLDVGGGSGIYSVVWLGINRQARSTQIDWANVNRIAVAFTARHGVAERFRTIDGDFHTVDFGTAEYDVGVYSHLAHQETPDDNVAVFRKFRSALKPGGTLVVNDFVVDDGRTGPPFSLIFHSMMLLQTRHGSTWTKHDYEVWLQEAGFTDISFHPTPSPATLVLAR